MAAVKVTKENFQEEVLNSKVPVLVDVDEQGDLASQYGIMSIPSLLVFKDGKLVKQTAGAIPKDHILEMVKSV